MNANPDALSGPRSARSRAALHTAIVAGTFSLAVAALLVFQQATVSWSAPLDSPTLAGLKAKLRERPADKELKQQIRAADLQLRQDFFRRQALSAKAAVLLLGGLAVFLVALQIAVAARAKPPTPPPGPPGQDEPGRAAASTRWAVSATAGLLGGLVLFFAIGLAGGGPASRPDGDAPAPEAWTAPTPPSPEEGPKNWPVFRGPGSAGVAAGATLPAWDAASGQGILWKAEIPLDGKNSPVAWGDRVFLTGADKERREVYAFDAKSGQLLWRRDASAAPGRPGAAPKVSKDTGFAAPTAATDGRSVAAIFPTGDLVCFDVEGKKRWGRNLGLPDNPYGHGASLACHRHLLFVQWDQGPEDEGKSRLFAVDFATGRTAWEAKRPVGTSWSTPIVIEAAGKTQVIACGNPWLIAHDAADGAELWRAKQHGEIAPSPVFAGGLLFIVNPSDSLVAYRPDGRGNVSKTHVAWKADDGIPDIVSPLADGRRVYLLVTSGLLTCYAAATGKKLWEKDFEVDCYASPTLLGDRVLILTAKGTGIAVAAADEFNELGQSELKDAVFASPAVLGGKLFIRGKKTLYAIGKP